MRPISDALELLTAQHELIDFLLVQVQQTYDRDAFDELASTLVAHLALEQELFYPAITSFIDRDVRRELLDEQSAIKRVLAEMVWIGVEDRAFGSMLHELMFLVHGHCEYQEDQLFEAVAETMPAEQLAALGTQLQQLTSASGAPAAANAA